MPNCAICHEPGTKLIDNIHLCGDCNLTMQSGSRDSLMQTLGLLARLAKVEAALTKEQQRTWAADLYETQLADQKKRIADLEAQLGSEETWYEIEVDHHDGKLPHRSTRLSASEAKALARKLAGPEMAGKTVTIFRITKTEMAVADPGNHVLAVLPRKV